MAPFLSIVTRCHPNRPTYLERNRESVREQTDRDYEHILLKDQIGGGLHEANRRLQSADVRGEYVLILDDDDMLADPHAVTKLKAASVGHPALVFFRADHERLGILPSATVWGNHPIQGHIGSCDFITRRDWWERHIAAFGKPKCGDFHFLSSMWAENPRVVWIDETLAAVQRISGGTAE